MTMDIKAQVTTWVEKKIGQLIDEDLKLKITHEYSPFNVQAYVKNLEDKYFAKDEIGIFKNNSSNNIPSFANDCDSCDSDEDENNSKYSLEFDNHEFPIFSVDEIIKNLESDSKDVRKQSLQALEVYAEEVINHTSWIVVQKTLLKTLKESKDTKINNLVLKVFFKFLICTNKPQIVCEGFTTVSKVLEYLITLKDDNVSYEEIYDLRGDTWLRQKSLLDDPEGNLFQNPKNSVHTEILIKLMWLLINCQQQMPEKWVRFNKKRLREIIFSFVHLLSSTNSEEEKHLTGLQLLSILNPTASWCRSWCHTAVGRLLLTSALRKYKNFFIHMIEIILNKIKTKNIKQSQSVRRNESISKNHSIIKNDMSNCFSERKTEEGNHSKERNKHVRSAPADSSENDNCLIFWKVEKNSKWVTESIPKRVVTEAIFWHSVSVVVCLIQFRCGQALFPIQTATRKRSLSAQGLLLSLTEYLENLEYNESGGEGFGFKIAYQADVLKKVELIKSVRNNILSSRVKTARSPVSLR